MKVVNRARIFSKIGYAPHDVQREVHSASLTHRFRCVCAGRRTGKSTLGGHELTCYAYQSYYKRNALLDAGTRMEYWIVGPQYSDSEKEFRVVYNDLKARGMPFDKPGTYNDPIGGNMHISLWDGAMQIHAKSAQYPDSLVGEGLHGVILAEAAKLKPTVWTKYIRPTLADYRGWALLTSTHEGRNWFYDLWMKGQGLGDDALDEWWSIRMPSWSNNLVFPGGREDPEIISLLSDLGQEKFNQEIGAEFTEFVGRVFSQFDEELHCRPLAYDPSLETYAAVDYGWTNPFVWLLLQVNHWGDVFVIGEYYHSHKRIDEIPDELLAAGLVPPTLRTFYPDPAAPGDTRVLEDRLSIRSGGGTGGELKERLRLIRNHLDINPLLRHLPDNHPEKLPRLFVDPVKCPMFVKEFNDYRYPENKREALSNEAEAPMKKDDHTPEALGRFFAGHWGTKERSGSTKVRGSTLRR